MCLTTTKLAGKFKQSIIYMRIFPFFIVFFCVFHFMACNGQNKNEMLNEQSFVNRKTCVAGQFYSAGKKELNSDLSRFFSGAGKVEVANLNAIISPHAGYVFSGGVAASAFSQVDPEKKYEYVFVLAPSHRMSFDGASIYWQGNYETPLGEIAVARDLGYRLWQKHKVFQFGSESHIQEHSLEVQLPFLQFWLKKDFLLVPIVIGTQNAATCKKIAEILKPYFNANNLFVISSDFSHYPSYEDACHVDSESAQQILLNDPEKLLGYIRHSEDEKFNGLATRMCGLGPVLTLLYMTDKNKDLEYKLLAYKNSGDSEYGDHARVVGYNAIGVFSKVEEYGFYISGEEKEMLLKIARQTLVNALNPSNKEVFVPEKLTEKLNEPLGAFVSLYKKGDLRGCIGRFNPEMPLYKVVQEMAVAAATQDHRFNSVEFAELADIRIEISVLTPMRKISDINEIEMGKHGIYIKRGYSGGTFLPQVADKTGWTREEFLGHCARDKAGIGWDGWKNAEIFTYEAIVFKEE